MDKSERLHRLRQAAQQVLDDLHRLPGFDDRLRSITITPDRVIDWDWVAISRALASGEAGRPPGVVRWESITEEDLRERATLDPEVARYLKRVEEKDDWWLIEGSGQRFARVFADVPPLSRQELSELALYAQHVRRFVKRYLFNVAWGPAAVHDSLRSGGRLVLPPAVPLPWMTSDTDLSIDFRAGDAIAPWQIETLRRFLLGAKEHPEHQRLAQEKRQLRTESRAALGRVPGSKDRQRELDEAEQLTAPPPPSTATSSFSGSAKNAVACVRAKLEGRKPSAAEKRAVGRTREHLEAALNPRSDLLPLQLIDDASRRRKLNRGAKALHTGHQLARDQPEAMRHARHNPRFSGDQSEGDPSR